MTEFSYCEKRLGVKYPWGSRLGKRTGLSQKLDKSHAGLHRASSRSCFGSHPLFSLTNSVRRQGGGYCDYNLCSMLAEIERDQALSSRWPSSIKMLCRRIEDINAALTGRRDDLLQISNSVT